MHLLVQGSTPGNCQRVDRVEARSRSDFRIQTQPLRMPEYLRATHGRRPRLLWAGRTQRPANVSAYGVVAGAVVGGGESRLARTLGRVSARDLPGFVCDVLKMWVQQKSRFNSFVAYVDAEGAEDIRNICERYRNIPDFEHDRSYFFDWGASEPFSLVGKGLGECSAGLFDLIDVDLKQIRNARKELAPAPPDHAVGEILYRMALSSARMLLVTRGIEAKSDTPVFADFSKHFISAGLVDQRFQGVIEAAEEKDFVAFRLIASEVGALAEAVENLYASMDNSLRFPTAVANTAAG